VSGLRYVRTQGDKVARRESVTWRKTGKWVCLCRARFYSAHGLWIHLGPAGDVRSACPVVRAEWRGQTELPASEAKP
jgi:hypothetical protein